MARSINPLAKLVTEVSSGISTAISEGKAAVSSFGSELQKAQLDAKVGRLSGDLTSGLNQAAAGAQAGLDIASSATSGALNSVPGAGQAVSAFNKVVQSPVGAGSLTSAADTISSLQSAAAGAADVADIASAASKLTGGNLASGIGKFASDVSKAAGVLNNLLSLKRAQNIPAGGELFNTTGEPIQMNVSSKGDWRVKINCQWNMFNSPIFKNTLEQTAGFVFPVLPEINLATRANYTQIDPTHNNYPFQAYKNSQVDEISISGQFPVENEEDAFYWLAGTIFFKTATKMFFGRGDNAGNPPIICHLSGYGPYVFDNVPIVIKSFNVDFPADVNYIRTVESGKQTWVPAVSTLNVTVQPIYNRQNLRQFSLEDYAKGNLKTPTGQGYL